MTDTEKILPIDALRVARSLLDGATPEWAAERHGLSVQQVKEASKFVAYRLSQHFRRQGHSPFSLDNPPQELVDDIIAVLVGWIDRLAIPHLPPDSGAEDKKKDTDQGEPGENP